MAGPYYVRSTDGSDASDGLTWANAKATLVGALAVAAAGERIWVSQVHAETQASAMTLTSAGTAAAPIEILCGNDAAEPPTALATTATVTTTGDFSMTFEGFAISDGVSYSVATGTGWANMHFASTASWWWKVVNGGLAIGTTNPGSRINTNTGTSAQDDSRLVLENVTVTFGAVAQGFSCGAPIRWRRGALLTVAPTTLFPDKAMPAANVRFIGVDLSVMGAGTALVNVSCADYAEFRFEDCKLGASVAVTTGTPAGFGGRRVILDNCDSADTNYRMQRHQYEGDVYSETTLIRTGGASDGTTGLSHKHVSSANSKFYAPLYGPEMVIWNDAVGSSQTVTCEILHDSLTNLQDDEVWLETEYLGTSGFPLSLFASDRMADILATPADQAASSETWTTTGMTNPNKQKLVTTQTPQEKGYYRCRVALAKPSYTVYACPKLAVA